MINKQKCTEDGGGTYHRQNWPLLELVESKCKGLWLFTWPSNEAPDLTINLYALETGVEIIAIMLQVERTNTNEAEIRGVVLVSYIAIKPLYISSPSLNDSAKRSPEASQAIFSMPL